MTVDSNFDVFFEKSPKGWGGVIFDPKNYIADFVGFITVYFGRKFWKKFQKGGRGGTREVIANLKNFIANLRIFTNFCKKRETTTMLFLFKYLETTKMLILVK